MVPVGEESGYQREVRTPIYRLRVHQVSKSATCCYSNADLGVFEEALETA
jgi:hypothetical protein